MAAKSSGGVTGCCFARIYTVCFIVSVATTTLLSASVKLDIRHQLLEFIEQI